MEPLRTCRRGIARLRRLTRAIGAILLAAAATTVVARQQAPVATSGSDRSQQPPSTPDPGDRKRQSTFRAEANYIRVDVFPTLNGQPVRDLTRGDFEILEDGVPQKIETFEHVEIHGRVPELARREPNSVAEGRSMAEDPGARVFAIFLDTYHTDAVSSYRMRRPLVDMLDRLIGPNDLYAVMTPEMSARDISLARRTTTIDAALSNSWKNWGRRNSVTELDPEEQQYRQCYPGPEGEEPAALREISKPQSGLCQGFQSADFYGGIATEMIARRREKRSLDALLDLSVYLGGLRDDRKAVIVVSDGWRLFRRNMALMRIGPCDAPPPPGKLGVGPDGRLTADKGEAEGFASRRTCERDRMYLAGLDNDSTYRDLLDTANRYNVSFYTIDPRGLSAMDADLNEDVTPVEDHSRLAARTGSLQTLAESTDGMAVVNSNDVERGVRRIVDDLTSYYLLGYYTGQAKLDGTFHKIKVRVKRPGVSVRARRGYRAPTQREMARVQAAPVAVASGPGPNAFDVAIKSLASVPRDARFLSSVSWIAPPAASEPRAAHVWVVGELDGSTIKDPEWARGGTIRAMLTDASGRDISQKVQAFAGPTRVLTLEFDQPDLAPGEYAVRLRLSPPRGGLPFTDTVRFTVPVQKGATGVARLFRRSAWTGVEFVPTADRRFRRTERLRVEVPASGGVNEVRAELLDRTGKPLPVPVQATASGDAALTWASAELALAPLAPGDYAVQTTIERPDGAEQVITAFRVVP